MNKYQENNIRWMDNMSKEDMQKLKDGFWSHLDIQRRMQCVECGKDEITKPIMQFYGFDPAKFKCYKCQNKT